MHGRVTQIPPDIEWPLITAAASTQVLSWGQKSETRNTRIQLAPPTDNNKRQHMSNTYVILCSSPADLPFSNIDLHLVRLSDSPGLDENGVIMYNLAAYDIAGTRGRRTWMRGTNAYLNEL